MQHLPIKSITLHAIGAMLVTVGIAICGLVIVLLSLEAQAIDVTVHAALRALCAYCVFLVVLAVIVAAGTGATLITVMLVEAMLKRQEAR